MNVRDWIGYPYKGRHGCLAFVCDVHCSETGQSHETPEHFYQWLLDNADQVDHPRAGDFALFKSEQLHIGYMINDTQMIHCYDGGTSIISDIDRPSYQATFIGFFRAAI